MAREKHHRDLARGTIDRDELIRLIEGSCIFLNFYKRLEACCRKVEGEKWRIWSRLEEDLFEGGDPATRCNYDKAESFF